jgi:hypothetical protein
VLKHTWFEGLDPDHLEPPFVPELRDARDMTYFECRYSFRDSSDADIEEDIRKCRTEVRRTPALRAARRPSPVSTRRMAATPAPEALEAMDSFPSVAVDQLQGANRAALQKLMRSGDTLTEVLPMMPADTLIMPQRKRFSLGRALDDSAVPGRYRPK